MRGRELGSSCASPELVWSPVWRSSRWETTFTRTKASSLSAHLQEPKLQIQIPTDPQTTQPGYLTYHPKLPKRFFTFRSEALAEDLHHKSCSLDPELPESMTSRWGLLDFGPWGEGVIKKEPFWGSSRSARKREAKTSLTLWSKTGFAWDEPALKPAPPPPPHHTPPKPHPTGALPNRPCQRCLCGSRLQVGSD